MKAILLSVVSLCFCFCNLAVADLFDGLVAHWMFDEGEGSVAYDAASTNHGTVHGATWITNGLAGAALSFDGTDDFVAIERSSVFDLPSFSISAWIVPHSTQYFGVVVAKWWDYHNEHNYCLGWDRTSFRICTYINGSWAGPACELLLNEWHHVVGTYDGAAVKLYLNGDLIGTTAITGAPLIGQGVVGIGAQLPEIKRFFHGIIDDVRIYNRALSAEEIQQLCREHVEFSAFIPGVTSIRYGSEAGKDRVFAAGLLELGEDSDGVDPVTEDVCFGLGTCVIEIPAGLFQAVGSRRYRYSDTLDGARIWFMLIDLGDGQYGYRIHVRNCDLSGTANPAILNLQIGDDVGEVETRMKGVLNSSRRSK